MQDVLAWLNDHPWLFVLFIVTARIVDVSLGTVRTLMVVRGYRLLSAVLGFFEVLVWVTAVSGVLSAVTAWKVIAYALGFALGNASGIWLEQRLALGAQVVTLISPDRTHSVAFALRLANYQVTEVGAWHANGQVAMCFVVVPRRRAPDVIRVANEADNDVLITVQDVRDTPLIRPPVSTPATGWRAVMKKK